VRPVRRRSALVGLAALLLTPAILAAELDARVAAASAAAEAWRADHEIEILADFRDLLSLPNVSTDVDDMHANADWIEARLAERDFDTRRVSAGGAPYVIAERPAPGAERTLLIYAHYDGQPVDAEDWATPPFEPTLRAGSLENGAPRRDWADLTAPVDPEWRVYARSAGDDKAPVIALMAALDALDAAGIESTVNLKLILDGEEEYGSPTLAGVLAEHADALAADVMLFCDGPMHQSRRRQVLFGVRGSTTVELTTWGPSRPLHSGHYGGWAPNPTQTLVDLLARMHDDEGRVAIPGFGAAVQPPTTRELAAIDAMPEIDDALMAELGLGRRLGGEERLERLLLEPAIVIKGLDGGGVGDAAANVIRSSATASLNVRIVPDQTPATVETAFRGWLTDLGFHVVDDVPTAAERRDHAKVVRLQAGGGYPGYRAPMDSPEAERLVTILDALGDEATLLTPTMGGTLPVYLFDEALGIPILFLPVANHDNNQHGRDENLRIRNLWDAIGMYAALLAAW
jgi:acetylornithine deacetylase/succinyl-diaminopimelate desuccinylase-like protein